MAHPLTSARLQHDFVVRLVFRDDATPFDVEDASTLAESLAVIEERITQTVAESDWAQMHYVHAFSDPALVDGRRCCACGGEEFDLITSVEVTQEVEEVTIDGHVLVDGFYELAGVGELPGRKRLLCRSCFTFHAIDVCQLEVR